MFLLNDIEMRKNVPVAGVSATSSPPLKGSPSRVQREVVNSQPTTGQGGQLSTRQLRTTEITSERTTEQYYGAGSVSSETWGSL
jgi:hypothetical protein